MNMQTLAREIIPHLPADWGKWRETTLSVAETGFIKDEDADGQWSLTMKHDENKHQVAFYGQMPRDKRGVGYGTMPIRKIADTKTPAQMAAMIIKWGLILEYREAFAIAAAERDEWNQIYQDTADAQARYMEIVPGSILKAGSEQEMQISGCKRWQVGPKNVDMDLRGIPHAVAEQILRLVQTVK
jgi:hypothetical protein